MYTKGNCKTMIGFIFTMKIFIGQYGKFYRSHRNAQWYKNQKKQFELVASTLGYKSVHDQKKATARKIKNYVGNGGLLCNVFRNRFL